MNLLRENISILVETAAKLVKVFRMGSGDGFMGNRRQAIVESMIIIFIDVYIRHYTSIRQHVICHVIERHTFVLPDIMHTADMGIFGSIMIMSHEECHSISRHFSWTINPSSHAAGIYSAKYVSIPIADALERELLLSPSDHRRRHRLSRMVTEKL